MARRHPDQALPTNHNGAAPPRPGSPQQSQRHSAAQTSNHNGTAPPRPGSPQQSQRHSATQTRLSPPVPTAQRHKAPPRRPPSRPILRAQRLGHKTNARERARTLANPRARNPKIGTNTVPPPDPPDKNKNPSLRIREQEPFATHSGKKPEPRARMHVEKSVKDSYYRLWSTTRVKSTTLLF